MITMMTAKEEKMSQSRPPFHRVLCFLFLAVVLSNICEAWTQGDNGTSRRRVLSSGLTTSLVWTMIGGPTRPSVAATATTTTTTAEATTQSTTFVRVPLHFVPSLSAYVVYYSVGGEKFGAIIDTGSPFLMVPSYCNRNKWGCYRPEDSQPSGLEGTVEQFDNNEGYVEWRKGTFAFPENSRKEDWVNSNESSDNTLFRSDLFTFGVLAESLMNGPGGVYLGLIRDTDKWIRPSFLGQTNVRSIQIDLTDKTSNDDDTNDNKTDGNDSQKSIVFSSGDGQSLLVQDTDTNVATGNSSTRTAAADDDDDNDNDNNALPPYIPLVRDLNKRYGDPAYHYAARASSVVVNGKPLLEDSRQPIYVIFDTGVSGMVVSSEVFEERYITARKNREKNLWGNVEITFNAFPSDNSNDQTNFGNKRSSMSSSSCSSIALRALSPITTPLGQKPWPKFRNAHLIVAGLSFLDNHQTTIDIDQQKLWFK